MTDREDGLSRDTPSPVAASVPGPPAGPAGAPSGPTGIGWRLPPATPRRSLPKAVVLALVGLNLVVFALLTLGVATASARSRGASIADPYVLGAVTATLAVALGIGFVVRVVVRRSSRGSGSPATRWALLAATLVLGLSFGRSVASIPIPPDPAGYLGNLAPYSVANPTAEQLATVQSGGSTGPGVLRRVLRDGTIVRLIVVSSGPHLDADAELTSFAKAATRSGLTVVRVTVRNMPAAKADGPGVATLTFVDGDFMVAVAAADDDSAMAIATTAIDHAPKR